MRRVDNSRSLNLVCYFVMDAKTLKLVNAIAKENVAGVRAALAAGASARAVCDTVYHFKFFLKFFQLTFALKK